MKPITPESVTNLNNKIYDASSAFSMNSLDNRLQLFTKSANSSANITVTNIDGTTASISFPQNYQGMFLLPFSLSPAGATSNNSDAISFISGGKLLQNTPSLGVTLIAQYNNLYNDNTFYKKYFINSAGELDKVNNPRTLRTQYGFNPDTNSWEVKGVMFESRVHPLLSTSMPLFGATGATLNPATDYSANFWNSTNISGITVWKIEEIAPTVGGTSLPENTIWFDRSSLLTTLPKHNHDPGKGISYSAYCVSAFFTGPNKIGGITKDIIQLWLASSPGGTEKKSVYFDVSQCLPVSVSGGGNTLTYYGTELYKNGWCRCFAGQGYTGATLANPAFGISTARRAGTGYTYGRLVSGETGYYYMSAPQIYYKVDDFSTAFRLYAYRTHLPSYVEPSLSMDIDLLRYQTGVCPSPITPITGLTGLNYSIFLDMVVFGPPGITEQTGGAVNFMHWRKISGNETGWPTTGNTYTAGMIGVYGLHKSISPADSHFFYMNYRQDVSTSITALYPPASGYNTAGMTNGQRMRIAIAGISGEQIWYVNGTTFATGTAKAIDYTKGNTLPGTTDSLFHFEIYNSLDKTLYVKDWKVWPRRLTNDELKWMTDPIVQGTPPVYKFAGGIGGYNDSQTATTINPAEIATTIPVTNKLPTNNYTTTEVIR